jgi:hypothetical protein
VKRGVLLDSNVWRYIVDADAIGRVRAAARASNSLVLVAPMVLYEAAAIGDHTVRRRIVEAVTRATWTRLMSDIYLQSVDVVEAIRRHRPEWLRTRPDGRSYYRLKADWSGGAFWTRARHDLDRELEILATIGRWRHEEARDEAAARRADFRERGIATIDVGLMWSTLLEPQLGWRGDPFAPWRADSANTWSEGLFAGTRRTPYVDWVGPWVDLEVVRPQRASWTEFWLYDVDDTEVPREWVRWAVGALQATRRVTDGTPSDNALATYLPDVDLFVTADKALADIVTIIRPHSPVPIAEPVRVSGGSDAVGELLAAVS